MPEKPEAQVMADRLQQHIAGLILTGHKTLRALNDDVALDQLPLGSTITRVLSYGKKVIFQLIIQEQQFYLITSLGMTGRWLFQPQQHTCHILYLTNPLDQVIYPLVYDDMRGFGSLVLVQGQDGLLQRMANVGPDLLLENITDEQWLQIIRTDKIKNWKLSRLLLCQEYFSGVGNYIRAEALYYAQLAPSVKVHQLTDNAAIQLLRAIRHVMVTSYQLGGFTIERFLDPTGKMGGYKAVCYKLDHDPEGNRVKHTGESGQKMWWVPAKQHIAVQIDGQWVYQLPVITVELIQP